MDWEFWGRSAQIVPVALSSTLRNLVLTGFRPGIYPCSKTLQIIDIYGHLIPGADISWIDQLDTLPPKSGNRTQTPNRVTTHISPQIVNLIGGPGGIRTPDQGIMSPAEPIDSTGLQQDSAAKCGKLEQNPHQIRTKIPRGNT